MKKVLPLIILATCASGYALEQMTVEMPGYYHTGTSSTRTYINTYFTQNSINQSEFEINLIGNSKQVEADKLGYMYGANDVKIRSFFAVDETAENGKGGVNLANATGHGNGVTGLTIDINSATEATAIDVAWWKQNYVKTIVKNSQITTATKDSPVTNLNFGEYFITWGSGTQTSQFILEKINANVTAGIYRIATEGTGLHTFQVKNTARAILNGAIEVGKAEGYKGYLDIDGTLITNDKTNVYKNSTVDVSGTWENIGAVVLKDGSSMNVSGTMTLKNQITLQTGSTATVSGTITTTNKTIDINSGATLNVSGNLNTQGGSYVMIQGTLNITNTNPTERVDFYSINSSTKVGGTFTQSLADASVKAENRGVKIRRSAYLNDATWSLDEVIELNGDIIEGADADVTSGKLFVNGTSKITLHERENTNARLIMYNMSKAYLNTANFIKDQNGNDVDLVVAKNDDNRTAYTAELHMTADQSFSYIYMSSDFKIFLDDDSSVLKLTRTGAGAITFDDASMRVYVYGFEDNRIYVGEHQSTYNILDRIIAYGDKEGKEAIGALTINNGWLVSAAVPEPAEWAMILGALALGLAIYRKRK